MAEERTPTRVCGAKRTNGAVCQAPATQPDNRCYWHSVHVTTEERALAVARGGFASRPNVLDKDSTSPPTLTDPKEIMAFLALTIQRLQTGQIGVAIARAVFEGVGVAIRLGELALAAKVAELESTLRARGMMK